MEKNSSSSFMKECLSKSIQWNSPQLMSGMDSDQIIVKLENLLKMRRTESFEKFGDLQTQDKLEVLLVDIKSKEFDIMKDCMQELHYYNPQAVEGVWTLYNQYLKTDFDKILCVYCKIRCRVDIKHCSRYLYRQNIISGNLHKSIILRRSQAGSQEDLWNDLEEECTKYHNAKHVLDAIYSGLVAQGDSYEHLITELDKCCEKVNPKFACTCQESCSELFMPNDSTIKTVKALSHTYDKENQNPKSDRATLAYGHVKAKTKSKLKCPDISQKVHTAGKMNSETGRHDKQNDPNLQPKTEENRFDSEQADSQQTFSGSKSKRKSDQSTNIYNFYNKGPVSFGTNVVDMKSGIQNDSKNFPESAMHTDNTVQRKSRLSLPSTTDKDETFAKRLKYNQSPPRIRNSAREETSDSTTDPSSEEDLESKSLDARLMEIENNPKMCKFPSMKDSGAYNISHAKNSGKESSQSKKLFSDFKSMQIDNKDTGTVGSRSFRRQKSAPSGY